MDGFQLRCNALRCRAHLSVQAVVTTCSHLYCIDCANKLFGSERSCPACGTVLSEPDDVVMTNLNPTDDYKTSVLSGLPPSIIMEIAARALSFWTYQSSQEIVYQEFMAKTLQDKYTELNVQMDSTIREANAEIGSLRDKISSAENEKQAHKKKCVEATEGLQEKTRQYNKLQALYEKLKRKSLIEPLQNGVVQNLDAAVSNASRKSSVDHDRTFLGNQNQWNHNITPAATPGRQRIMLDTARNKINVARRPPLETLQPSHPHPNTLNFMATPRQQSANHSFLQPGARRGHAPPGMMFNGQSY